VTIPRAPTQLALLEELRMAMSELFGSERRLRGREQQQQSGSLTHSQLRALALLASADAVPAGDLAKTADLNPASVTAMLDHLEKSGIVQRRRDSRDRRVCLVSLTEAGQTVVESKRAHWQNVWDRSFGDLSETDLEAGLKVLKRMTELLESL
jgi:MarR family transcriptional regulator, organic hydroperoxide resistance regulator